MSRRHSPISPLLATSRKATRLTGRAASLRLEHGRLRLRRDNEDVREAASVDQGDRQRRLSADISRLEDAAGALRLAEEGLSAIEMLLTDLDALTSREARPSRAEAGCVTTLQVRVDGIISAMRRLADRTRFAGQALFGGEFVFAIDEISGDARHRFALPAMGPDDLGHATRGRVSRLASAGSPTSECPNAETAGDIIAAAAVQVSELRLRVDVFLETIVMEELTQRHIELETFRAAETARDDMDFVPSAGGISPLQAMVGSCANELIPQGVKPTARLTIRDD